MGRGVGRGQIISWGEGLENKQKGSLPQIKIKTKETKATLSSSPSLPLSRCIYLMKWWGVKKKEECRLSNSSSTLQFDVNGGGGNREGGELNPAPFSSLSWVNYIKSHKLSHKLQNWGGEREKFMAEERKEMYKKDTSLSLAFMPFSPL